MVNTLRKLLKVRLSVVLAVVFVALMVAYYFFSFIGEYVVLILLAVAFTSSSVKSKKLSRRVKLLEAELAELRDN
ncbi:hypothetical protein [Litoribacillus peritrichatus]|uniref:DUF4229 domain-containing protein n=1 Tax=Litoribacillus peritrichatus TaxID=718191 RepID=A0ABP7M882_9GAMM